MISRFKFSGSRFVRCFIAALCTSSAASALLVGCSPTPGPPRPSASDIEPFVLQDLGACPLWKITDVQKTDSVDQGTSFKVDFSATLTLRDRPEKVWEDAKQEMKGSLEFSAACADLVVSLIRQPGGSYPLPDQQLAGATLSEQYKVTGHAVLVKSEKGWQLVNEIHTSFAPIGGNTPPSSTGARAEPVSPQVTAQAEVMETPEQCLDKRMRDWDKNRADEIEQLAAEANARGEEVQVSAGMEDVLRTEAMTRYTAECQQQQ